MQIGNFISLPCHELSVASLILCAIIIRSQLALNQFLLWGLLISLRLFPWLLPKVWNTNNGISGFGSGTGKIYDKIWNDHHAVNMPHYPFCNVDTTLPAKGCIVKAMIFPIVMYGFESWTIKKAVHWRIDAFELWCWTRLESSLDCTEIKPVNPEGNQPWIFRGRTYAEPPILWPPDAGTDSLEKTLMLGKIEVRGRRD